MATCSGQYQPDGSPIPDGERTYTNNCTIKVVQSLSSYHALFRSYTPSMARLEDLDLAETSITVRGQTTFAHMFGNCPMSKCSRGREKSFLSYRGQTQRTISSWVCNYFSSHFPKNRYTRVFLGFALKSSDERYVPVDLSQPHCRLTGVFSVLLSCANILNRRKATHPSSTQHCGIHISRTWSPQASNDTSCFTAQRQTRHAPQTLR